MKFYHKNWFIWLSLIIFAPLGIILLWSQKKYKIVPRTILSALFLILFLIIITPNSNSDNTDQASGTSTTTTQTESHTQNKSQNIELNSISIEENLEKIEVTYDLQGIHDKKRKVVIWILNNSDKILSGNLRIDIKSREDHILAIDNFPIDEFKPGQKKYAVMWADTDYPVDKIVRSWSNVEFMEPSLKEAEKRIDEEATKEIVDNMYMNFGGAGNPEYKTSWYDYIEKIEVYTDGENKWAEVTLSVSEQDKCNQITRSILYSADYLIRVKALDGSGNQILEVYK